MKNIRRRHAVIYIVVLASLYLAALPRSVHAAGTCTAVVNGAWNSAATWQHCGSGTPGAGDTASISSGVVVQVTANTQVAQLNVDTSLTGQTGVTISSSVSLNVSGAVDVAAPLHGSDGIFVGDGTLRAGNIMIVGGSGGDTATIAVHNGIVDVSGNIGFGGIASGARLESTGSSTINIGGDLDAGGTLITNGTGTINFDGDQRQIMGPYATYNNVGILNRQNGRDAVSIVGPTKINGALRVVSGALGFDSGSLQVGGSTTIDSRIVTNAQNSPLIFGDLTISDHAALFFNQPEPVTINGNLMVNGGGDILGNFGTWTFKRAGGGVIGGTATATSLLDATFATSYSLQLPLRVSNLAINGGQQLVNTSQLTIWDSLTGGGTLAQDIRSQLWLRGTLTIHKLDASASGNTVSYIGNRVADILPATYQTLDLSQLRSGSATAGSAVNVDTRLSLGGTLLAVHGGKVTIGPLANVGRTNGYVVGSLSKIFAGNGSFSFPIGDATNFTPIDLTVSHVSDTGAVTAAIAGSKLSDTLAGRALLQPSKGIKRTWTLSASGLSLAAYDTTLHFVKSDVDTGANPSNMSVAKRSGGVWRIVPGACASLSCIAASQTSLGDFQAGVRLPGVPSPPPPPPSVPPTLPVPPAPSIPAATTSNGALTPPANTAAITPSRRTAPTALRTRTLAAGATQGNTLGRQAVTAPSSRPALFDVNAQAANKKNSWWRLLLIILLGLAAGMIIAWILKRKKHAGSK